jgi:iron complex transport system ATP-binding protein
MPLQETIKLHNFTTGYRTGKQVKTVTQNLDATLYSNELTCLLGQNGAGKSTLLKTLAGFMSPIKGEIYIQGKSIDQYTDSQLAKVIGVVLTEKPQVTNMTVEELIGLGRSPYTGFWGNLDDSDRNIVNQAISLVGIEALRHRNVASLSDGERQKAMIAKALAQETSIIFLDEPTAFLDYPSKVEIMQLLHSLARTRNKTIFLSTHDIELALQISDKIWLLDKEIGTEIGTPEDLSLSGALSRFFDRKGIRFDLSTGTFHIDNKLTRHVCLNGSGPRFNMVQKALIRCGIGSNADSTDIITVTDSAFILNSVPHPTIESLLTALS